MFLPKFKFGYRMNWFKCKRNVNAVYHGTSANIVKYSCIYIVFWNIFTVWDAGFVTNDNDSGVINLLYCIENEAMNDGDLDDRIFLLGASFKRTIRSKSIILDSCGGRMSDASIVSVTFDGTVIDTTLVCWKLRGGECTSVNHCTRFYLRNNNFRVSLCVST